MHTDSDSLSYKETMNACSNDRLIIHNYHDVTNSSSSRHVLSNLRISTNCKCKTPDETY